MDKKRKSSPFFDQPPLKKLKSDPSDKRYVFVSTNLGYGEETTVLLAMKKQVYDRLESLLIMLEDNRDASDYSALTNGELSMLLTIDEVADYLTHKKLEDEDRSEANDHDDRSSSSSSYPDDTVFTLTEKGRKLADKLKSKSRDEDGSEEEEEEEEEPDEDSVYDEDIDAVSLWFETVHRLTAKGKAIACKEGEKTNVAVESMTYVNLIFNF